ncbi:phosphotransferase enzyme family protein [Mucilaginibacter sp.]|jgi:Ser/Thr protein kinase RdoA (MazF antagonist)|uniref:phosphotransferase enzyme family protein n=1 Tax=Mucilaginibacter sp. TaxID=1882438 RepID=UPI0035676083
MPLPGNIDNIISHFDIKGSIVKIQPFGSGHINDTFRLQNADAARPDYLLQRINHQVFKNVPALMENILRITEHLKAKLPANRAEFEVITVVKLQNGNSYHQDENGNYWRVYHFLKDTKSYDLLTNQQQAYEGGKAFGKFQLMLTDLDAGLLHDTIPGFHDMELRLNQLKEALLSNKAHRAAAIQPELDFVNQRAHSMCEILRLGNTGKLPLRITHNDTKFNNVLLDKNDHAKCVIDLDTVMPGYVAYDFGDAIRTIINTAAEDEADLHKIDLDIQLFEAYTKGYLEQAGKFLTPIEVDSLLMGVLMLPFIQAVRFLTDHINGDIYFKIHHPGHNLQRARAQMQLINKLEENQGSLKAIINDIALTKP